MFSFSNHICADIIGVFKIDRNHYVNTRSHSRNYDIISIRLSGNSSFKTGKEEFSLMAGDVLYIPPNVEYTQRSDSESIVAIHFINHSSQPTKDVRLIRHEKIDDILSLAIKTHDAWSKYSDVNRYACDVAFYELLFYLKSVFPASDDVLEQGTARLQAAIEHIHEKYKDGEISISALAEMCALSEPYFRKLFKATYGISPLKYISQLKLDHASHLLQSGLYSVNEVAERSGYSDSKYFSKLFKAEYGTTPKKYQQSFFK